MELLTYANMSPECTLLTFLNHILYKNAQDMLSIAYLKHEPSMCVEDTCTTFGYY